MFLVWHLSGVISISWWWIIFVTGLEMLNDHWIRSTFATKAEARKAAKYA